MQVEDCSSERATRSRRRLSRGQKTSIAMVAGKERYVLSSLDKFLLVALLALFGSAFHTCESFSPGVDSRHLQRLTTTTTTRLGVVETKSPSSNPTPLVGPFPSRDETPFPSGNENPFPSGEDNFFGSLYPQSPVCESGETDPDDSPSQQESEVSEASENSSDGSGDDDEFEDESDLARNERLAKAAMAAQLLSRRRGVARKSPARERVTSVGARRVGSVTKNRGKASSVSKLVDAVRKGAAANTGGKSDKDSSSPSTGQEGMDNGTRGLKLTRSVVQSAVQDMIGGGLLGNPATIPTRPSTTSTSQQNPPPGTILLSPGQQTKPWNPADRVSVRVATEKDDSDIASLRLSVFSNFSSEMRKAFVSRSCHVLSTRRNRGATCIVATVPRYGSIMSQKPDIILGSAECSFHEFHGTSLGKRRQKDSVLYLTEVAVSPTSRRKGIGMKLMQAMDQLAQTREAETLFLHVDVDNEVALNLYERCGYSRVPQEDFIFHEFTKSLNLHDGATKGRNHFLMYKDLKQPTWLPADDIQQQEQTTTLGFEIPC